MAADPIGKSVGPVKLKVGVLVAAGSGCKLKFDHFLNAIKWRIKQLLQFRNNSKM